MEHCRWPRILRKSQVGHYGPAWLTTKFCHIKDLARKNYEIMSKNICHRLHINYEILANFGTRQNDCQNLGLPKFWQLSFGYQPISLYLPDAFVASDIWFLNRGYLDFSLKHAYDFVICQCLARRFNEGLQQKKIITSSELSGEQVIKFTILNMAIIFF